MKFFFIGIGFFLLCSPAFSQSGDLLVRKGEKGLYLEHKTEAKQNFYSIGRLYNVHPRLIAAYNSLDMNKGLALGQVLHIPLTDSNFSQQVNIGAPVYYNAGENDNLSKISSAYNKVPVENLRRWNKLSGEKVAPGTDLIIGFLVSGEISTAKEIVIKAADPAVNKKPENKIDELTANPQEVIKKEMVKTDTENVVKEEPKKTEPIFTQAKDELKSATANEGYFKMHFDQQIRSMPLSKEETVTSGIFKTVSGWRDHKYYLLIDKVEPGTIVQITNPVNNKSIYAKVLYGMEGIRQNEDYGIRISDAAANELEISDIEKFIVKVKY